MLAAAFALLLAAPSALFVLAGVLLRGDGLERFRLAGFFSPNVSVRETNGRKKK